MNIKKINNSVVNTLLTAFLVVLAVSCSTGDATEYLNEAKIISVKKADSNNINLSSLGNSVEYLYLDTPENLAIAQIDKVTVIENQLFVLDRDIASALFSFDLKGRYIFDIQSGLGGPGEVLEFSDFDVSELDQELYILDNDSKDIKVFNFSGDFIRKIRLPFFASSISILGNEIAVFRNNQFTSGNNINNDQVMIYSKEGKQLRSFLPIYAKNNYLSYHDSFRPFQSTDSSWIFSQALNDTIYEISNNTLIAKYLLDFDLKSLRKIEDSFFNIEGFLRSEQRLESQYLMGDTFENNKFLLSLFYAGKTYNYAFYDKLQQRTSIVSNIENDLDYVPLLHIKYLDNERLIADLPAELLLSLNDQIKTISDKNMKIRELVSNPLFAKENPILMLINLSK